MEHRLAVGPANLRRTKLNRCYISQDAALESASLRLRPQNENMPVLTFTSLGTPLRLPGHESSQISDFWRRPLYECQVTLYFRITKQMCRPAIVLA